MTLQMYIVLFVYYGFSYFMAFPKIITYKLKIVQVSLAYDKFQVVVFISMQETTYSKNTFSVGKHEWNKTRGFLVILYLSVF